MWLKVKKTHLELSDYHVTAVPLSFNECFSIFQLILWGILALSFAVLLTHQVRFSLRRLLRAEKSQERPETC